MHSDNLSPHNPRPLMTVGVPVYNIERFISAGISQLKTQTFSSFEVVIVDDGSSDSSLRILEKETAGDSRFRLIEQTHQGVGEARNLAIKAARGHRITFFDLDDNVSPEWLADIYEAAEKDNPDILIFGYKEHDIRFGTTITVKVPDILLNGREEIGRGFPEFLSGKNFNNGFVWNKVYNVDFLRKNNIRFPNLAIQQDEVFNLRCYMKATRIRLSSVTPLIYNVYSSGNNRMRIIPDRLDIYRSVYLTQLAVCDEFGCRTPEMEEMISRRFIGGAFVALTYNTSGNPDRIKEMHRILGNKELQSALDCWCASLPAALMKRRQPRTLLAYYIFNNIRIILSATAKRLIKCHS